ncbi:MAG: hypothetical protein MUP98_17290 [Candidatus Aminicenantes bacterium]|nr:hypothetical protein [Candidatus Aminicenantes bacterium]
MVRMSKGILSVFVLCLFLSSLVDAVPVFENQVDTEILYKEISGRYEFIVDGQVTIIDFHVKDGSLYGTSEGDNEEVEVASVDLEKMSFEATDSDGEFYEITFLRDEDKKITKCLILTGGMEIEGTRIGE